MYKEILSTAIRKQTFLPCFPELKQRKNLTIIDKLIKKTFRIYIYICFSATESRIQYVAEGMRKK